MWKTNHNSLTREFKFNDYKRTLEFVNKVGRLAEDANHHPEISFGYGFANIALTTHSENKITDKDVELSEQIDQLIRGGAE